ncbi:MAG: hypothetical protein ACYTEL_22160 [Planctomycetota bacterium]|jgi:pectin methylesterase-like acyl-CoA thioesterase
MKAGINNTNLCVLAAFLFFNSGLFAADRLVPDQYSTIQAAIDAADDNDTIVVAQGTYYENIDSGGKSITVTSTDPNDPNVVETTVIDGNGSGTVVTLPNGANMAAQSTAGMVPLPSITALSPPTPLTKAEGYTTNRPTWCSPVVHCIRTWREATVEQYSPCLVIWC